MAGHCTNLSRSRLFVAMLTAAFLGLSAAYAENPADRIDLRFWKLTLPLDADDDGKIDEISVHELRDYSHPDFFHVDEHGWMVVTAPNKAATTANSTNARSELRQMLRGFDTSIGTHDRMNNFALEATLRVLKASENAKYPDKLPAFSVVVGQIHAIRNEDLQERGFGYGNEPLKIFYKKWPGHETGSVFWTHERNLATDDPDRTDIAYPVWGRNWDDPDDPAEDGIAIGQLFNYNINAHGNVDEKDNPGGYAGDALYFKAGAYNQCSVRDDPSFRYPACAGTGDWATDKASGDYVSVAFRRIDLSRSVEPQQPSR